jgi:hypothetical protein
MNKAEKNTSALVITHEKILPPTGPWQLPDSSLAEAEIQSVKYLPLSFLLMTGLLIN